MLKCSFTFVKGMQMCQKKSNNILFWVIVFFSEGSWMSFNPDLCSKIIIIYIASYVFYDKINLSFVGDNSDLAGNAYKGDSLIFNYQNNNFKLDSFYLKSKLLAVKNDE